MAAIGKILLADDEQTFRESTAELLRQSGYDCDCVADAAQAVERLRNGSYDLLIADIKMPGNPDLELIKQLKTIARGTPAIVVTAYPSQKSAIDSVQLPVSAYLVKPVDFNELKRSAQQAIRKKNLFKTVTDSKQRLADWQRNMQDIEEVLQRKDNSEFSASIRSFLDLSLVNISAAFQDIKNITLLLAEKEQIPMVCNLMNCPRLTKLVEGLTDAVRTLEKTKSAFKSKELGLLRIKLEQLLKQAKDT